MNPSCWLDIPLPEKARCALVGTGTVGPLIARSSLTRTRQMSWRNLPSVRLSRRGWPEMVCAKCLQGALALAFYPRWGSVAQNISRPPQGSERPHRTLKQRESAVAHVTENHGPGCRRGAPGPSSSWPWGLHRCFSEPPWCNRAEPAPWNALSLRVNVMGAEQNCLLLQSQEGSQRVLWAPLGHMPLLEPMLLQKRVML